MRLRFHGLSDIGLARTKNQDVWFADPELGFFALADGIGGRKGGEVAAQVTIQSLASFIKKLSSLTNHFQNQKDLTFSIRKGIDEVNQTVHLMSSERSHLQGMGSTLCCLLHAGDFVYCAHVGDSRIYRYRDSHLEPLTHDHSLFARWLAKNQKDTPSPPKNIITRAIGMAPKINPEISCTLAKPDDLYFLCSDGLTDVVDNEELKMILEEEISIEEMAQKMIISAKNKGSGDNITVLIVSL